MPTVREFVTKWGFDVDDRKLKVMDQSITKINKNLAATAKLATDVGKNLSTKVTLPVLALGGFFVKAASDAEETTSKFQTVFKDISDASEQTSKDLAKNFGLSQVKAKELLGDTGDLLTGFGFTQDSALDLSKQVNELAVDLASFTNFSGGTEGASKALTKALLGEREAIKSLGVSILEEDVKKRVQINRAKGLTFETERQAKAFATLQLAQEQSKNAIGDFARTSGGFANQVRILRGEAFDMAVEFGKILLPVALKLVKVTRTLINFFKELSPATKTIILVLAGLAAVIGPLLILFGAMVNAILAIRNAMLLLRLAGIKTFITMALPALKLIAILAAFGLVMEDLFRFFRGEKSLFGLALAQVSAFVNFVQEKFPIVGTLMRSVLVGLLTPINLVISGVKLIANVLGALAGGGGISAVLDAAKSATTDFLAPFQALREGRDFSISESVGLGENFRGEARFRGGAQTLAPAGGGTTQQITLGDTNVTVPPNTPPEAVGPAVTKGVEEAMTKMLRQTQRQGQGTVVN